MSNLEALEEELGIIWETVRNELASKGMKIGLTTGSREADHILLQRYLQAGKYDVLIDYFLEQYDAGGGEEYFIPLSNWLVERGEKSRVIRLWRAVIAIRRQLGLSKTKTLETMRYFLDALERLGETQLYAELKEDMDLLAQGKRPVLPAPDHRKIDEMLFWEIIDQVKHDSVHTQERPYNLSRCLEKFSASAIKQFAVLLEEKLLALYHYDLWAIAYIARGGCSDDGFQYFREWLVSEGQQAYATALNNPEGLVDAIADSETTQLEGFVYAPAQSYARRANKELTMRHRKQKSPTGVDWTEEDLPIRFPLACKKFGWRRSTS